MRLAIQICSELEWKETRDILQLKGKRRGFESYFDNFEVPIGEHAALVFYSGATKTGAAAACQHVIDRWRPDAVINLGTCGGIEEGIKVGTLVMATRTFQYDVEQKFGTPSPEFTAGLTVDLDVSWADLGANSNRVLRGLIVSADRDLDYPEMLRQRNLGALAADWESASIATVCGLNKVKCLILRGVSDIPTGEHAEGKIDQGRSYERTTGNIMRKLFDLAENAEIR